MGAIPHTGGLEGLRWRRLENAYHKLDDACAYAEEVQQDIHSGVTPSANADLAYRIALRVEQLAIQEYVSVLKTLTDLVCDKIPEEGSHTDTCDVGQAGRCTSYDRKELHS